MDERLINIIAGFLQIPPEKIVDETIIDRSALKNSIILHRMYGKISELGFTVNDYNKIRTFGELRSAIDKSNGNGTLLVGDSSSEINSSAVNNNNNEKSEPGIGVDIENISSLPVADDYRQDQFYLMNFGNTEMAYCILQPEPVASFAGLFAAKEAIVKANNVYLNKPFNQIIISHTIDGKPEFPGAKLSISHAGEFAIAVAVFLNTHPQENFRLQNEGITQKMHWSIGILVLLTFLIALAALILTILK